MDEEDEKVLIIRKAIQCAFDIQREMDNKKIMATVTGLSVKVSNPNIILIVTFFFV